MPPVVEGQLETLPNLPLNCPALYVPDWTMITSPQTTGWLGVAQVVAGVSPSLASLPVVEMKYLCRGTNSGSTSGAPVPVVTEATVDCALSLPAASTALTV